MSSSLARKHSLHSLIMFALPNMVMMIFMSLYVIVDGMFISRFVGTDALSATNMVYPAQSIEMATAIMVATGGSAIIARKLGEGKPDEAKGDLSFLVLVETVLGILTAIVGVVFCDKIIYLLGASEAQFEMCRLYQRTLFWFAPLFFLQTAFQVFFITAGKPGLGLIVTVAAGVANVVLDYIFMVPLGMGIRGAAIATGIGYFIGAVSGVIYFAVAKNGSLCFTSPRRDFKMLLQACSNGSSEMVTNLSNAVTTFLFNYTFLKFFGEDGVASITIILYFQFVFTAVFFGYSNGVAPIISFKYGSGDAPQLKTVFKNSLLFVVVCSVLSYALSQLSISTILTFFTPRDSSVYSITMSGFYIYSFGFLLMGTSIYASAHFTALSDGAVSAIISFARTFIFLIGSILILPYVLGETGVWLSVPVAELLGIIISILFLAIKRKKYRY